MRRVGRNVGSLAGSQHRFDTPKGNLDLTLKNREHLFEIMSVRRWAASGWDQHVNQAVMSACVLAFEKDCVGISNHSQMRQVLISVWPRHHEMAPYVIGWN